MLLLPQNSRQIMVVPPDYQLSPLELAVREIEPLTICRVVLLTAADTVATVAETAGRVGPAETVATDRLTWAVSPSTLYGDEDTGLLVVTGVGANPDGSDLARRVLRVWAASPPSPGLIILVGDPALAAVADLLDQLPTLPPLLALVWTAPERLPAGFQLNGFLAG